MKFNFKIQQYQTDAVEAVARVFNGQGHYDKISYIRDLGKKKANQQMGILAEDEFGEVLDLEPPHDHLGQKIGQFLPEHPKFREMMKKTKNNQRSVCFGTKTF